MSPKLEPETLRAKLSAILDENPSSFDAITDQIERAAEVTKDLGGLDKLTEFDRARVSHMIEAQIGMGIERGDFDFVFHRRTTIEIPEFKIARLELGPDDVVVLKAGLQLDSEVHARLKAVVREVFPHPRKILILSGDLEIATLAELAGAGGLK
jgi:hypothetical protein